LAWGFSIFSPCNAAAQYKIKLHIFAAPEQKTDQAIINLFEN
jgi:hypothetical protein